MRKMQEESKSDKETMFDNQFAGSEVLVQVNEYVLTSLARNVAYDNVDLHAVLRRDLTYLNPKIAGALGAIKLDASSLSSEVFYFF